VTSHAILYLSVKRLNSQCAERGILQHSVYGHAARGKLRPRGGCVEMGVATRWMSQKTVPSPTPLNLGAACADTIEPGVGLGC
jgi:hypothetical protein